MLIARMRGWPLTLDRDSFVPLYAQLRSLLERQIARGDLSARNGLLPSEPDLCRLYGVSRMTVRQALGDLQSAGLIRREPGRGTFVSSSLPNRGLTLALIYGGFGDDTFGRRSDAFGSVVRGIAEIASQRRADLRPMPLQDRASLETVLARAAACQGIDGLLVRVSWAIDERDLEVLNGSGLPYVIIKRRAPKNQASCVLCDDADAARGTTLHLLDRGHCRLGLLIGPRQIGVSEDRRHGFEAALVERGMLVRPQFVRVVDLPLDEGAHRATVELMRGDDRPTGLVAASDHIAVGVYRGLRELGLEPGRDVGVACIGDGSFANYMHPALTMATIPIHELGRTAADLLIDLISGAQVGPKTVVVPWRLEVRDSTPWR